MTTRDRLTRDDGTVDPDPPADGPIALRARRLQYVVMTALLCAVVGAALLDAVGLVDLFGVQSSHVSASGGGYDLDVEYASTTRPGLATPLAIVVHRAGGFDGPVRVAIEHDYLTMWDENGFYPSPSSETADATWVLYEFDPPPGDTLRITYDARIEPAAQRGRSGRVAVMGATRPVAEVAFTTRVMP